MLSGIWWRRRSVWTPGGETLETEPRRDADGRAATPGQFYDWLVVVCRKRLDEKKPPLPSFASPRVRSV
ncbi:hypothetical protein EYF80_030134 [Liparis tanakae]|uniref:Uncharacterized protein n=1 Tax=Liparis tanakae TaxID=230148 RepID=A0A4Z2H1B9_9TELE|nr:hypothetical protein EYF80_030134 [Liparis tanakae]